MFNFKTLIANKTTAADLADAIAETETVRDDAADRIRDLNAARPALLLQAPDAQVRKNESDIADARLAVERAGVALDELRRRHAEAVIAELKASVTAQVAAARIDAERGADLLGRYSELASEMAGLLTELKAIRASVRAANQVRGDAPKISPPEMLAGVDTSSLSGGSIESIVRLPTLAGTALIWPKA
jgi:hypothetical protein